jgi:TolB-like protein
MGVVYAAHDDRLDRPVAIKVIRPDALADAAARERFRREARAAARVSHPHICPLYEFDEDQGQPFLVMELLDGEPLSVRLARGAIPLTESLDMAATVLDALAALHRRGIVHRDLKPANIFLTPHGLKLLDFGLAQPLGSDEQTRERLTGRGDWVGTPQYMAPEQLLEGRVDERADVFAAAAVIYEMVAGRPAFSGPTVTAIIHAIGYLDPPPLDGPPDVRRLDGVLRQALVKDPDRRVGRADELAVLLRDARSTTDARPAAGRKTTRFIALPMRVLRPDPDTDFLAVSVPDAVSTALAVLESVIVRSPQLRAGADPDIRAIGRDLAVDVVLTGTILRAGRQVRVSAQLADAATGTLIWSDVAEAPIDDLFQLQDTLTRRIVSSLALPLTAEDRQSLNRQAPASAEAYELYLRANELITDPTRWADARDLYERAVAVEPDYAPAWARLGRVRRVLAKWGGPAGRGLMPQAEAAFRRAFEIDPDLSMAHDLAAYVDAELGRAPEAMERLLRRAIRRPADTGLLAGLVTTCRYAGLLEASRAAHQRVASIDPGQTTSVAWTYFMLGDYDAAIEVDKASPPYCAVLARLHTGRLPLAAAREIETTAPAPGARLAIGAYRAAFEGNLEQTIELMNTLGASGFDDPEGWYLHAFSLAQNGFPTPALELLTRAVDGGYACHEPLTRQPEWKVLPEADYARLVERTRTMVMRARERFEAAGGTSVLGPVLSASSRG